MEILSHLFGTCGENHPSLSYMLGLGNLVLYISIFWNWIRLLIKNMLKRLNILNHHN